MVAHSAVGYSELRKQIRQGSILFAGNAKLQIYGKLNCSSGKRMKRENRVFFMSGHEAVAHGFRPCGHCLRDEYKTWKNGFVQQ